MHLTVSEWHGTPQELTVSPMAEVVAEMVSSVLLL
jgi:hypothetical protein